MIRFLYKKGEKMSKEDKAFISELVKEGLKKLGTHPNKGKHFTEEHKRKLGLSRSGEKNWNWKGGITPIHIKIRSTYEYKLWKMSVLKRDNYTCIWCGSKKQIEADHIKPSILFPELRFAIDNGRTLCKPCHMTTNTYGGRCNKL